MLGVLQPPLGGHRDYRQQAQYDHVFHNFPPIPGCTSENKWQSKLFYVDCSI
jgi:hypothetical protein